MGGDVMGTVAESTPGVGVSISVEQSDNGVIITGHFRTTDKDGRTTYSRRSSAVTTKDVGSDMAKRKIQRTMVKWVQAYFPAPKRADAGKKKGEAATAGA